MKRKWLGAALGLALLAFPGTFAVQAEETQTEETAEDPVITFTADDTEITVKNETDAKEVTVSAEERSAEDTEDGTASWAVTFSDGSDSHLFETEDPSGWTDAALTEDHGFWYIQYSDADGTAKELSESADGITPEEELTMWTLTDVYVRESPDPQATALDVASVGGECKVTQLLPGWYKVEYNGTEGYIKHTYLTDEESEAEAAKAAEENAQAAAAAQSSSSNYSYSYSGSSGASSSSGNTSSAQECLENGLLN